MKIHFLKYNTHLLFVFALILSLSGCRVKEKKYDELRESMINDQIKARGIIDKNVIAAMSKIKRHDFVPENLKERSYEDTPLPIGYEQTISQPYIVAFMTELLKLNNKSRVLEIGTGSGYQAAVLAEICKEVYTIEIIDILSRNAMELLKSKGYTNVYFKTDDGYKGWPEKAPFDAIIVTCAPENIPPALKDQLAEGGTMLIPVGRSYVQKLVLIKKKNGMMNEQSVLPVRFVPMVDEEGNLH